MLINRDHYSSPSGSLWMWTTESSRKGLLGPNFASRMEVSPAEAWSCFSLCLHLAHLFLSTVVSSCTSASSFWHSTNSGQCWLLRHVLSETCQFRPQPHSIKLGGHSFQNMGGCAILVIQITGDFRGQIKSSTLFKAGILFRSVSLTDSYANGSIVLAKGSCGWPWVNNGFQRR